MEVSAFADIYKTFAVYTSGFETSIHTNTETPVLQLVTGTNCARA